MLFKILQGPSSRIDVEATPLHEGFAYFTPDNGGFYIDAKINDELRRIQINPNDYVLEQNNGEAIKFWRGTQEEYDAIEAKDDSVLYLVTDADGVTLTDLSNTFVAMYNKTSATDIYTAYQEGNAVFCVNGDAVGALLSCTEAAAYFSQLDWAEQAFSARLFIVNGETWSTSITDIQEKIYESGILKGDGGGNVLPAVVGEDYAAPDHTHDLVIEGNQSQNQKFWRGTKAEYDAIEEKDESVLYIVTDDNTAEDLHIPEATDQTPLANGEAAVGASEEYARADHVHPQEVSDEDRTNWNTAQSKAEETAAVALASVKTELENSIATETARATAAETQALTDAKTYTDQQVAMIVHPDEISIYEATIGTEWAEDADTGVKTQTVTMTGVSESDTVMIDCVYDGDYTSESYATFVERKNQFLTNIGNGFSETVDGGIRFTLFGDANTVEIPIIVKAIHHEVITPFISDAG